MRWPLVLAAANFWIGPLLALIVPAVAATVVFNLLRCVLMAWAGWCVTRQAGSRLAGAACAGVAIMVVDHVLLKGGSFLFRQVRGDVFPSYTMGGVEHTGSYLMAFGGVLVSFVMFAPLAGIVGGLGGYAARKRAAASVA